MHIAEGVLSPPVLAAGALGAAAGLAIGLRRMDADATPRVAVLSSAFFVASLIHVPVGPASAHLILNGLAGLVLGWAAFPAIFTGLLLQALFFGHGGLAVLGANTVIMAAPAVLAHFLFRRAAQSQRPQRAFAAGACAAALATMGAAAIAGAALWWSDPAYAPAAGILLAGHVAVAAVEAAVTGAAVSFLAQVRPEALQPAGERAYG